jgi:hypothetical protein
MDSVTSPLKTAQDLNITPNSVRLTPFVINQIRTEQPKRDLCFNPSVFGSPIMPLTTMYEGADDDYFLFDLEELNKDESLLLSTQSAISVRPDKTTPSCASSVKVQGTPAQSLLNPDHSIEKNERDPKRRKQVY